MPEARPRRRMGAVSAAQFLIDEGNVARGHRQFAQARELFGRAANAAGGGPQAATALIDRGGIELSTKDYA